MIYLVSNQLSLFETDKFTRISVDDAIDILRPHKNIEFDTETAGLDPYTKPLLCSQYGVKDTQIVVDNTITFDSLIEDNIEIIKSKLYPPTFDNSQEKLQNLVIQNAHKIYGKELPDIIKKRIDKELEPINKYGFSVIY